MAEIQTQPAALSITASTRADQQPPQPIAVPQQPAAAGPRTHLAVDAFSPVNQNGSFEFDRVIKSGYVQKRTQKTKVELCASNPGNWFKGCAF
jgi:hypothetical protein